MFFIWAGLGWPDFQVVSVDLYLEIRRGNWTAHGRTHFVSDLVHEHLYSGAPSYISWELWLSVLLDFCASVCSMGCT